MWLREHAQAPWVIDLLINEDRDGQWVSRREEWSAPLDEVTWVADDRIRYQNPEVVLHHKALGNEERDRADRDAAWPLMDDAQRAWLREAVLRVYGADHQWLAGWTGSPPPRDHVTGGTRRAPTGARLPDGSCRAEGVGQERRGPGLMAWW